jgi:hypothetical protein
MDDPDDEVVERKRKKIPLSEQPGSLPAVAWRGDRPRPVDIGIF